MLVYLTIKIFILLKCRELLEAYLILFFKLTITNNFLVESNNLLFESNNKLVETNNKLVVENNLFVEPGYRLFEKMIVNG